MMNQSFASVSEVGQRNFIVKVFVWMTVALAVTGFVAYYTVTSEMMLKIVFGTPGVFFGLIIAELLFVLALSAGINKMSSAIATAVFFIYATLNGVTLSAILLNYTSESVATTFFITAAIFGLMSAYGYFANADLTRFGSIFAMGLIGIVIASLVNMFIESTTLYKVISYVGVVVFTGLIAYDAQKLKVLYYNSAGEEEREEKASIIGALTLYLDFVNLFIMLLRFFGKRR